MSHKFNLEKAIQAFGVLLRREGKRASRLRLLKLLYIAERRCIKFMGRPIVGSRLVALKNGPLHSDILDLINGIHTGEPTWSGYFRNDGKEVVLEAEPSVGLLSRQEIELLNQVSDQHGEFDDWEIVDITHGFEEWTKHYPDPRENTSRVIPIEDVIAAVGRSEDCAAIIADMQNEEVFSQFFSGLTQ